MESEEPKAELAVGMHVTEQGFGLMGEIVAPGPSAGQWVIQDRNGKVAVRGSAELVPWELNPRGSFQPPGLRRLSARTSVSETSILRQPEGNTPR